MNAKQQLVLSLMNKGLRTHAMELKTDLHNIPQYLSVCAVQKLFAYLLYLFSRCCSCCKFIKNGKLNLYHLMCLVHPQNSSKDNSILHQWVDIFHADMSGIKIDTEYQGVFLFYYKPCFLPLN